MRKMITTLNAMVRDDVVWADRLPVGKACRPHGSRCADRLGRVKAVAARSAGARSASLDAAKSISDLAAQDDSCSLDHLVGAAQREC